MQYFAGLTTVDFIYPLEKLPGVNEKIKTDIPKIEIGGPATNAAITCAALGKAVVLITAIGENPLTSFIIEELERYKVKVIDVMKGQKYNPVFATILNTKSNGDRAIVSHFPEEVNVASDLLKEINFANSDQILIDGFFPEIVVPLCEKAKKSGVKIVFDGGSWKTYLDPLIPFIDIAICSNDFMPPSCSNFDDLKAFFNRNGVTELVVSRGEKSLLYVQNNRQTEIDVGLIKAVDTTGAGDVLHGAFMAFYLETNEVHESIAKASKVATFKCRFKGAKEWINNVEKLNFYNDLNCSQKCSPVINLM